MADAGGTTTLVRLSVGGPYNLYIVHNTSVDTSETIPVDITGSPIVAEDRVMTIGAQNWSDEVTLGSGGLSVEYDETAMHYTVTDADMTAGSSFAIAFFHIPQNDGDLGSA